MVPVETNRLQTMKTPAARLRGGAGRRQAVVGLATHSNNNFYNLSRPNVVRNQVWHIGPVVARGGWWFESVKNACDGTSAAMWSTVIRG